ncbi:MAG: DNA/RNA non-specific endonuclease [candidate division Zixibacteria bacterium]
MKSICLLAFCMTAPLFFAVLISCDKTDTAGPDLSQRIRPNDISDLSDRQPIFDPGNQTILSDSTNLRWGISCDSGDWLAKEWFTINFNCDWKIPYWAAYYLNDSMLSLDTTRSANNKIDQDISSDCQARDYDYSYNPYDKGHVAPAAAFRYCSLAYASTYYWTNISPQHEKINQYKWKALEVSIRNRIMSIGNGWIITGHFFDTPNQQPDTFLNNRVAIPTHLYKAVLFMNDDSVFSMAAYLIPNASDTLPYTFEEYCLCVDQLELITGYDFFPLLEDGLENYLEGGNITSVGP